MYYNVSGYLGGLRQRSARTMIDRYPIELIERVVWGMLPKGRLGRKIYKKLLFMKVMNINMQHKIHKCLILSRR